MVSSCCVKVCNSSLHDRKGQNLTTKNDMLHLTLEKKTKLQEASPRRMGWVAEVIRKSIIIANISLLMFVYTRHFDKGKICCRMCLFSDFRRSQHLIHMLFGVINAIKQPGSG